MEPKLIWFSLAVVGIVLAIVIPNVIIWRRRRQ